MNFRTLFPITGRAVLRVTTLSALAVVLTACGGGLNGEKPAAQQQTAAPDDRATALTADPSAKYPDHHEFDAALDVPFTGAEATGAREFAVHLDYVGAPAGTLLAYRVELRSPAGAVVKRWSGVEKYAGDKLMWYTLIHLAFVASALFLAFIDRVMAMTKALNKQKPPVAPKP